MPTDVWANLRPERRERVLTAAMAEFGGKGFSAGSLNVIAREAGVAKGSLFQYFADKLDLFATVCDEVSLRNRAHMEPLLAALRQNSGDFFGFLARAADEWVAYFADHPLERGISAATELELDPVVRDTVRHVSDAHYLAVIRPLVLDAAQRGELRADADTDALLALLLMIVPHLALAPYLPGLDPVFGMYGLAPAELRGPIRRLTAALSAGFGPSPVQGSTP